jgi:Ca-activated chloride channel family protein
MTNPPQYLRQARTGTRKSSHFSHQGRNDMHTAGTLQKIGAILQIALLIFSLMFAFNAASARSQETTGKPLGGMKIIPIRSTNANSVQDGSDAPGGKGGQESDAGRQNTNDDSDGFKAHSRPVAPIIQDALLLSSEIEVQITGLIVHTTVKQTFKNQTTDWIEGLYRFPLPDKSAVDSMTMLVGDRRIVGKIKEKEAARKTYADAVKAGKKVALLQEHRPNMFSTKVGNVAPGSVISVELTFLSYAEQNGLMFDWAMPQAITPRFNFDQALIDGNQTSIVPSGGVHYAHDGFGENPNAGNANKTSFNIHLNAGTPVQNLLSKSHDLTVTSLGTGEYQIGLKGGALPADRDFRLSWALTPAATAKPILFRESGPFVTANGEEFREQADYILGLVLPPEQDQSLYVAPRDVVFIIDTSGSMGGASIRQAKTALLHAIDLLRPEDKFDIIEFNSNFTRLFGKSETVTPDTLARARNFVRRLDARGGTNMMPALSSALNEAYDNEAERQVLFLTDGAVGYEEAMFRLVEEKLGEARLFTVGIGSAPNGWFMRKAAEFGRGLHIQISDLTKAGEELASLYSAMATPTLSNLNLMTKIGASSTTSGMAEIESYPAKLPDLFGTRPAVFIARTPTDSGLTRFELTGKMPTGELWQANLSLDDLPLGKGIAKMWARKKVEGLMDARTRGMNPDLARDQILDVALAHKILSPFTSFVAVEEKIVRPNTDALKNTHVKGNLPHGTEARRFVGPRTATPLSFKFISGMFALFLALIGFLVLKFPVPKLQTLSPNRLP